MKYLVILAAIIGSCVGVAIPKDNHHYVEGESQYIWLSKDEGQMVLVDLWDIGPILPGTGADNEYWLFTRKNPKQYQVLKHGDVASVRNSNYDASKNTVFLVHGWANSGNTSFDSVMRDTFLAAEDCNAIVVDWSKSADGNYARAAASVPSVGEYMGDFLKWFVKAGFSKWNKIHLVGHSLGAHVVGIAGRRADGLPTRVTGLDPAGPLWYLNPLAFNNKAGRYVEAIHTDGGLEGILLPCAHADFYPNGGTSFQPGCDSSGCSHARSYQFYALSVLEDRFVAKRCTTLANAMAQKCSGETMKMGNKDLRKSGTGIYGLEVSEY